MGWGHAAKVLAWATGCGAISSAFLYKSIFIISQFQTRQEMEKKTSSKGSSFNPASRYSC